MKKKILSLFLAALMVVSILPVTALAETKYDVNNDSPEADKNENGGYITVDKEEAAEGDTVTITVCPNEGYQLLGGRVYYEEDEELFECELIPLEDGTFTFVMPASNVTAEAWFEENSHYRVEYDEWWDEDSNPTAKVEVNGQPVSATDGLDDPYEFTPETALTFTLTPPTERASETPIVEIEVSNGEVWRSDFEEDHKITITDKGFTFTPKTKDNFIVRIWWSEYDAYCGEEGEYLIQVNGEDTNGTVTFDQEPKKSMTLGNQTKYVYDRSDLPIVVTITPNPGYDAGFIVLGGDFYTREIIVWEKDIFELYDEDTGTYQYEITGEAEGEEEGLYIEAHFDISAPIFEKADPINKVVDEATFDHYEKGVTSWLGFTFDGWYYMDGQTEKEFTDGYGDACEQFPGVTFTAKWMDESGAEVPGETIDEIVEKIEEAVEELLKDEAAEEFNKTADTKIEEATGEYNDLFVDELKKYMGDETSRNGVTTETLEKFVEVELIGANVNMENGIVVNNFIFNVMPRVFVSVLDGDGATITIYIPIENTYISEEITFHLPVAKNVSAKTALVYHEDQSLGIYDIMTDEDGNKYIEVKSNTFSEFSYVIIPEAETDPDPIVTFTHGDPIVLGEKAAKAGEANPNTGAPVLSMSLGMAVLTGAVLLLSKKKH